MNNGKPYRLAIIGGGINGLCAAFAAIQQKLSPILLIDQFDLGHNRGSSHGHSRITRSAYANEDYVNLMQVAHESAWPDLERVLGTQLIYPTEGCFFGPAGSKYDHYAKAVTTAGVDCSEVPVEEARLRYPQFRFENTPGVIIDRTAGLVAAQQAITSLAAYAKQHIDVIEGLAVTDINLDSAPIELHTKESKISAESVIVTAGPWVRRLIPTIEPVVTVARQTVGYITLKTTPQAHQLGSFPVWGDLGGGGSLGYYGLPEFGRPGIKVAKHVVRGRDDDPDQPEEPSQREVDDLRTFIAGCFAADLDEIIALETCHYTNTENEDYIIDRHPDNPSCAIGAGFSGHGFKLGPVTGRALVDLAIHGQPTLDAFVQARQRFALNS
jgi:sarcosine oxidase